MDIDKIYNILSDKGFQDPGTGNLFFPAYIYTYDCREEYKLRKQINKLTERLLRPNNFLECLSINIFDEFIAYLKENTFAGVPLFDQVLKIEKNNPGEAQKFIENEIDNSKFYQHLQDKINRHFEKVPNDKKVYLIVYGFGTVYPYLRASTFLKRSEKFVKNFKLILFYPGNYTEQNYNLFGLLKNENIYRANLLNNSLSL